MLLGLSGERTNIIFREGEFVFGNLWSLTRFSVRFGPLFLSSLVTISLVLFLLIETSSRTLAPFGGIFFLYACILSIFSDETQVF